MTIAEVQRECKANKEIEERRMRNWAHLFHLEPQLIGVAVASLFGSKGDYPEIVDIFPDLFDREEYEERKHQQNMKQAYNNFMAFASQINKRR